MQFPERKRRLSLFAGASLCLLLSLPLAAPAQAPPRLTFDPTWPGRVPVKGYGRAEVTGVATDASGNVYVCHRTQPPILVFDRAGKFLYSIGAKKLVRPHTVRIDSAGDVWTVDKDLHQVFKFRKDGLLLRTWGMRKRKGLAPDRFNIPTDVAFAPNGDLYVSDGYGNSRVVRYSRDGRYLGEWGSRGVGIGQFNLPHSVAVDAEGRVYVADRENSRIQVFTEDGKYLFHWNTPDPPFSLFITPSRELFVANGFACTVSVYTLDGHLVTKFGQLNTSGLPGELADPHMLCVDDQGSVYTAELRGRRAQRFKRAGF